MKELVDTLRQWQSEGRQIGRAVVIRTYGSAPRQAGSVLLYSSDGALAGSVSGGCVEAAAATDIETALTTGTTRVVRYGISDEQAWDVGLACGGMIDVLVEPAVPDEAIAAATGDAGTAVVTPLPSDQPRDTRARLVYTRSEGLRGTTGSTADDKVLIDGASDALLRGVSRVVEIGDARFFVEAYAVKPRLVVVGAVEIARPLVRLASALGFTSVVIDGRPSFVTRERFPDADELIIGWADEIADRIRLSADDCVAVLSHDPKFDEPAIAEALKRGCRYVGAIGSKKTQADRRARLREQGFSEAALERLHGPIGLDLGGREPAEIALAILAEIVAARYGASGESLSDRARALQTAG
jgi:xanthine dehydrogenase accessory factor